MTRQPATFRLAMFFSFVIGMALFTSCSGDNKMKMEKAPAKDTARVMDTAETRPIKPGSKSGTGTGTNMGTGTGTGIVPPTK